MIASVLKAKWQLPAVIALAIAVGTMTSEATAVAGVPLHGIFDFLGTLFVSALKMLIVPLVSSSLIVGIGSGGTGRSLRQLGIRAISFYLITTVSAILLGMVLVNVVRPGIVNGHPAGDLLAANSSGADLAEEIADKGFGDLLEVILGIVPTNVISAAAGDDLLGVIFFSVLFGYFMGRLDPGVADPMLRFWTGVFQVMTRITEWVLMFAPVGVFGLVAPAFARMDTGATAPLMAFALVVLAALAAHALLTLPALLLVIARVSPVALYRAVAPAVCTAFASASSSAALPVTMDCMVRNAGVSNRVSGLVLPLGAAVNLNGTALYECVAAIFLAQAYGLDLDLSAQFTILAIAVVSSVGLPGVPLASLVAISVILSAIGLPGEAIGALLVFDRLLDMARTGVNVLGDTACAVLVARFEGEETALALPAKA